MRPAIHGRIFLALASMHCAMALSPLAFFDQFARFASQGFFQISEGLLEFPMMGGQMNYENFAAFWFFYFGLALVPIGLLVRHLEQGKQGIPRSFKLCYLGLCLLGAYMIPLSGMTFLMLPHALYMYFEPRAQHDQSSALA